MADIKEIFATLEDSLGNSEALTSRQEGESVGSSKGAIAFNFKDSSANVAIPSLTSDGKIMVDTEAYAGAAKSGYNKLTGTTTLTDSVTLTLENSIQYIGIDFHASSLHASLIQVVAIDNGSETLLSESLIGPGHYSNYTGTNCISFTSGATGTQELVLRAKNFEVASDIRTYLCVFGINATEGFQGGYLTEPYLSGPYLGAGSVSGPELLNRNFVDGNWNNWTLQTTAVGATFPTIETYNPASSQMTSAENPGSNNFYGEGGTGDTDGATNPNEAYQNLDVSSNQGDTATVSGYLGGAFTGDSVALLVEFRDSGFSLVGTSDNQYMYLADTLWNGTDYTGNYQKTAKRGKIDYSSGYKYIDDSDFVVYQKVGDPTVILIKHVAFGGDRWEVIQGITWDFDDLVDNFDIGSDGVNYTDEIVTTSGDETLSGLKYPPASASEVKLRSDSYIVGHIGQDERWNGSTFVKDFWLKSLSMVVPATAEEMRVRILFMSDSSGTIYGTADEINVTWS